MSECDLFLRFRYDYNMTSEDLFREQVEQVQVFIFDMDGNYLTTLSESGSALKASGYKMKIPESMYDCTMIVWAGHTDRFYTLPTLVAGDHIEKLTLKYTPQEQTGSLKIDNLWHSGPAIMSFPDESKTMQTVSLIRDTNDFDIEVNDQNGTSMLSDYQIKITAANGSYNHKNEYLPENPIITYLPYAYLGEDRATAQFRTLRLLEKDKVTLSVLDADGHPVDIGGESAIDLVEYLLKTGPTSMGAQEFLDRCYQWQISLIVEDSQALAITINNWVHWFHPTEL